MLEVSLPLSFWQRVVLRVYGLLSYVAVPLALVGMRRRSRTLPEYRHHIAERLGRYDVQAQAVVWVHAVSVGEVRAAQPLVQGLLAQVGGPILVTTMTPTGRATARELFGDSVLHATLCWDTPAATRRFFAHFAPRLGVIMDTEVWPNLMASARAAQVPMVLANARLSEKSLGKALRIDALARPAYATFAQVLAQSDADAQRLKLIGVRHVQVTGSIKFDVQLDAAQLAQGQQERGNRAGITLLLASTRDGEEAILLQAVAPLIAADAALSLMVVPRRPQRFDEVAALLTSHGLQFVRRSAGGALSAQHRVLLGDTMGEMAYYFGSADIAVVGGGWLPHGGSNHIEACAAGCATIVGPHTFNFADATEKALAAGAVLQLEGATQLPQTLENLIGGAQERTTLAMSGRAFAKQNRGAAQRMLENIAQLVQANTQ
ncbi:MAG: 3-deoxy-D-manno-octulosonic acid transferase [Burkholderiaceae bacterium]